MPIVEPGGGGGFREAYGSMLVVGERSSGSLVALVALGVHWEVEGKGERVSPGNSSYNTWADAAQPAIAPR